MSAVVEISITIVGLVLAGVCGALVSTAVHAGHVGPWASWLVGQMSIIVWAFQARTKTMSLITASALFDIVYSLAWVLTYCVVGHSITLPQALGMACLLLGMVLVNL